MKSTNSLGKRRPKCPQCGEDLKEVVSRTTLKKKLTCANGHSIDMDALVRAVKAEAIKEMQKVLEDAAKKSGGTLKFKKG